MGSILLACSREQESPPGEDTPVQDLVELESQVSILEKRAQQLKDINDIKRLQRAYGYYLDNALWDEILDLMSNDATFELALDGVYIGKDSIGKYLYALGDGRSGLSAGELNEHLQLQPVITVADDGKTAQGRWRAFIMSGTYGGQARWSEGPYENTYVKEDGIWKISSTHWYETIMVPYEGGWAAEHEEGELHNGKIVSNLVPPDAPSSEDYEVWPGTYLPPYHYKNPVTGE